MNKLCQCFRPVFLAAIVVAALIAVTGCGPRDFVIAERGKPADCTIVCGEDADPAVRYAAEELRDYVKKLTDVELPINGNERRKIVISEGGLCDVPSDGFAILATEDDVLRISGTNPRGCIYGVYDLLERYGGVGFYSSWCEKVPRLDRLAVPAMSVNMSAPAFEMREPFWYDVNVHLEFGAKPAERKRCIFASYRDGEWVTGWGTVKKILPDTTGRHPGGYVRKAKQE